MENPAPTQPKTTSKPAGREARAFPRVTLPMTVRIGEADYTASDWSVTGFGLNAAVPGMARGDVSRATLALEGAGVDVHIPLTCEVVRDSEAGALGFRIVGLAPRQAEVLHRIVDDYLAGQTPALEQLLFRDAASTANERVQRRWFSFGRVLAQLLVVCALLTAAGYAVLSNILTFGSHYAAITAPAIELASPATGIVSGPERSAGTLVAKNEILFQLANADDDLRRTEQIGRREQLEALKSQQMDRLLEVQSVTTELNESLRRQMAALDDRVTALNRRIAFDRQDLARARELAGSGYASRAEFDRRSAILAARQQERAELEQERVRLAADLRLAQDGVYRSDLRDNVPTVQVMLSRIDETQAAIDGIDHELARLAEARNVRSPCDCVVHATQVRPGELVRQGARVLVLREAGSIAVEALILGEDARKLAIGGRGAIALADGSEASGRIVDIAYDGGDPLRVGLPEQLFAAERFARVRLQVDGLDVGRVGMTGAVDFRLGWFDRLLASIGL